MDGLHIGAMLGWSAPLAGRERVPVEYAGEEDGEKLPCRHDRREQQGSVALDRVHDEELPCASSMQPLVISWRRIEVSLSRSRTPGVTRKPSVRECSQLQSRALSTVMLAGRRQVVTAT